MHFLENSLYFKQCVFFCFLFFCHSKNKQKTLVKLIEQEKTISQIKHICVHGNTVTYSNEISEVWVLSFKTIFNKPDHLNTVIIIILFVLFITMQ